MCGRFTLRTPLTVLAEQFLFDLGELPIELHLLPRHNIAPTQDVAIVRRWAEDTKRHLALVHWGLVPGWAKDTKIASKLINARSETIAEKPSFRVALARRRCLVLADGFYEWKKEGKQKLPMRFSFADGRPFAFAGLWECWRGCHDADGKPSELAPPLESCTIITTTANTLCAELHERMPVILNPADYDLWLDPAISDRERLLPLLQPCPPEAMRIEPIDPSLVKITSRPKNASLNEAPSH
jgi:putative SOS response-associated peptidase YedK